ncbi:MAG: glycosyltransferase [Pelagimonas sp.]|jgi:GT2 family glycosyltransferase|nr:glycosyltransferase [Pelagimonas sp.]
MAEQSVSIIVVSRGRPDALALCLTGLSQLDHACFEIVVVGCPQAVGAVQAHPSASAIKLVPFDQPNISIARNLGIAAASGDLVAFIDDDAVPEPLWLRNLTAPFVDAQVEAAGGYVIGRNGISLQWGARRCDPAGDSHPLDLDGPGPHLLSPPDSGAIKTEGTNMAFRRATLLQIGGFDPGYAFYLDETDLNMRLAAQGAITAIVPDAQVHHGFAPSDRRRADRTPTDLTAIGASQWLYLRKYLPEKHRRAAWRTFRKAQRQRLLRLMQRGPLGADDVWRLMRGLDRGRRQAEVAPVQTLPLLTSDNLPFMPHPGRPGAPRSVISGRSWQARHKRAQAADTTRSGAITSLYLFSPTTLFHHATFTQDGYWEQRGGLFGRSKRQCQVFRYWRFSARVRDEVQRNSAVRG